MKNQVKHLNIQHIDIEDLFGIYTYSIPADNIDISQLLILYGQNGAGKTTILQMIFNLLSSEHEEDHKTELANTKFKKISITLSDKSKISAYRRENLVGGYTLLLEKKDEKIFEIDCSVSYDKDKYHINSSTVNSKFYEFLSKIRDMDLSIHFLSDDRKVKSNISMILNEKEDKLKISNIPIDILYKIRGEEEDKTFSLSDIFLQIAIKRVENWFNNEALKGNTIGQSDIQEIYFNLITELLDENKKENNLNESTISKEAILEKLNTLNKRNKEFIKYNLTLDFDLDKYIDIINISDTKLETIENILKPYIEGIEKRLNAIEDTKNIIDTFVTTLNDFYIGKELKFSIGSTKENGIKIYSQYNDKEELNPATLSSGEKQLLLLFCNTITAREQASIFIIDEPELSLNVVWQRKLINALLEFSKGSSIQFILASHSIELLSNYSNNVSQLKNSKEL
jgi:energy-coupling factor transporter ATP-binding protein EcfA2